VVWNRSSTDGNDFNPEHTLQAGSRYVNAVAYIQPTDDAPKGTYGHPFQYNASSDQLTSSRFGIGYVVTGGQDTVINIFNLENPRNDPDFTLLGHSENVCTLDVNAAGTIISGSWDK
jgi:phospholipase A-2-activating protein